MGNWQPEEVDVKRGRMAGYGAPPIYGVRLASPWREEDWMCTMY